VAGLALPVRGKSDGLEQDSPCVQGPVDLKRQQQSGLRNERWQKEAKIFPPLG